MIISLFEKGDEHKAVDLLSIFFMNLNVNRGFLGKDCRAYSLWLKRWRLFVELILRAESL